MIVTILFFKHLDSKPTKIYTNKNRCIYYLHEKRIPNKDHTSVNNWISSLVALYSRIILN